MAIAQDIPLVNEFPNIFPPDIELARYPKRDLHGAIIPDCYYTLGAILGSWERHYTEGGWKEHVRLVARLLDAIHVKSNLGELKLRSPVVSLFDDEDDNTLCFYHTLKFDLASKDISKEVESLLNVWKKEIDWLFRATNAISGAGPIGGGGPKETKSTTSGEPRKFRQARFMPLDEYEHTLTQEPQRKLGREKSPRDKGRER